MALSDLTDEKLWPAAAQGDAAALARLLQLAQEVVRSELLARGARPADLEDLVQTVLASVLAQVRSKTAVRELRAFLKYRAWGVLSDHRKRRRTRSVEEPAPTMDHSETQGDPQVQALRGELGQALADCVKRLNQKEREVVELRHAGGLSTKEIAARLGLEQATVYVRWHRALHSLEQCLAAKGFQSWSPE
jgi:RNA polymerase sigma factor (sigma-70 family)